MKTMMLAMAAGLVLAGCAGGDDIAAAAKPAPGGSLEGGPWLVESINGVAIDPMVRADLTFEGGDQNTSMVFGTGGCNRLRGGWQQTGSTIKLGPIAGTMMMCEPEMKMQTEQKLMKALEAATTVSFASDGAAMLTAADGGVLKLRREPK
jgi:heat shock protein HslJ